MLGIKIATYYLRKGQRCYYLCYFCGAEIFAGMVLSAQDSWHPGIQKEIFEDLCGMFRHCSHWPTGRWWAVVEFCNFLSFVEPSLPLVFKSCSTGPLQAGHSGGKAQLDHPWSWLCLQVRAGGGCSRKTVLVSIMTWFFLMWCKRMVWESSGWSSDTTVLEAIRFLCCSV